MQFRTNLKPTTYAGIVFELKELLVSVGWTVPLSSDGSTVLDGDLHETPFVLRNANAWFVIQAPPGRSWMFQNGTDPDNEGQNWLVKYSPAAGFSGGSATESPIAADEQSLATFELFSGALSGKLNVQIAAEERGEYGFWLYSYEDNHAGIGGLIVQDPLIPGTYPPEDTDPVVVLAGAVSSTRGFLQGSGNQQVPYGLLDDTMINVMALSYARIADQVIPDGLSQNPHNGRQDLAPVLWARPGAFTSPNGWKGISTFLRWTGADTANGSRLSIQPTFDRLAFGDVAFPWDGATRPANIPSEVVDLFANDFGAPPVPGPQPTITEVSPADGTKIGETFDEGRWQAVSITVEDVQAHPVFVWAKVDDGAFSWQVVYDGAEFGPLWAQTSQVEIDGDTRRFSILPLGGWTASPTIQVGEFREITAS